MALLCLSKVREHHLFRACLWLPSSLFSWAVLGENVRLKVSWSILFTLLCSLERNVEMFFIPFQSAFFLVGAACPCAPALYQLGFHLLGGTDGCVSVTFNQNRRRHQNKATLLRLTGFDCLETCRCFRDQNVLTVVLFSKWLLACDQANFC